MRVPCSGLRAASSTILLFLGLLLASRVMAGLKEDLAEARTLHARGDAAAARSAFMEIAERHGNDAAARSAWYYLALLAVDGEAYLKYLDLYLQSGGGRDRRAAEVQLRAGRYLYAKGDYREALTRFEEARDGAKDPALVREARYWSGMTLMALRETADARQNLEAVAADRRAPADAERAMFALGELFRLSGNYQAAAGAYQNGLQAFPRGAYAPAHLLGQASARELLGEAGPARRLLTRLIHEFPASAEAAAARKRLRQLRPEEGPIGTAAPVDGERAPAGDRPAGSGGGYSVQLGAFAIEENALKLADDLSQRNLPLVRVERDPEDGLYHVIFGAYPDPSQAERAGDRITAAVGLRYRIVPPEEP